MAKQNFFNQSECLNKKFSLKDRSRREKIREKYRVVATIKLFRERLKGWIRFCQRKKKYFEVVTTTTTTTTNENYDKVTD